MINYTKTMRNKNRHLSGTCAVAIQSPFSHVVHCLLEESQRWRAQGGHQTGNLGRRRARNNYGGLCCCCKGLVRLCNPFKALVRTLFWTFKGLYSPLSGIHRDLIRFVKAFTKLCKALLTAQ